MAKVAALTAALERAYRRAAQAERREQTQVAKYRDTVKRLESEKSTARQQVEYYRREYTRWEKQYNDVCVLAVNVCVGGCTLVLVRVPACCTWHYLYGGLCLSLKPLL